MKAAVIHAQGAPDVLRYEDRPDPVPGPEEVVIAVEAISLEGGDLLNRSVPPVAQFPHVIGYQAAGTVLATGAAVTTVRPGQRVAGFSFAGSHAEQFCVIQAHAFAVPDGLDIRIAATVPVTFGTADEALFGRGGLKAGETVLVHGGAGGVGLAAIQLARAAGATVIATCRARNRDLLRALGCDHPVAYDEADVAAEVLHLTAGRGVDLAVDLVGGGSSAIAAMVSAIACHGRLSVVGLSSGIAPSVSFWDIAPRNITVHGILFGLDMHTPRARAMLDRHFAGAAAGTLRMPIAAAFPLRAAADAHRHAEEARPAGRVLILP